MKYNEASNENASEIEATTKDRSGSLISINHYVNCEYQPIHNSTRSGTPTQNNNNPIPQVASVLIGQSSK